MDVAAAARLAATADPKAIAALQKDSRDPAVAKAVAAQFGALLMQRVMQNSDGEAIGMAGGVGGNIVNTLFASTMSETAMSGDRLGLADLLFRSMTAKQRSASGGAGATSAAAAAGTSGAQTGARPGGAAAGRAGAGLPLSPYWQGHGLRPIAGAIVKASLEAGGNPAGFALPPRGSGRMPPLLSTMTMPRPASPTASMPAAGAAMPAEISDFAQRLAPLLRNAAQQLGVSPRVLLAQAALETGWGRSVVGNNIFGVKAGSSWAGAQVSAATHEIENGQSVPQTASFRAYGSLDEAVRDFVSLIAGSSRYRAALGSGDDARSYGAALIAGGYATDDQYPDKLAAVAGSPAVTAAFAGAGAPPPQQAGLAGSGI